MSEKSTTVSWRVKEFSKMADVSIQTLHYYDKIGLLKPYKNKANGYRCYKEKDLKKIKRILVLKFFGFDLKQIKKIFGDDADLLHLLEMQIKFLAAKVKQAKSKHAILKDVVDSICHAKVCEHEEIMEVLEKSYDELKSKI